MLVESRLYLHGRPSPHPLHKELAMAVCENADYIDKAWPWQENKPTPIIWLLAELWNAVSFRKHKSYQAFLIDNLHLAPILAKKIGVLRKKELSVHLGSHTLYFLQTKRFNAINHRIQLWALSNYDKIICEGRMAADMVVELNPKLKKKIAITYIAPDKLRKQDLLKHRYQPSSKRIVTVCSGPSEFRKWYKGLDIMISVMKQVLTHKPDYTFEIAGEWAEETIHTLLLDAPPCIKEKIQFVGKISDIPSFLENAELYLHISRGDAFPTSTMEAMDAGLPVILSNVTGTKEFLETKPELITDLTIESGISKVSQFLDLTEERKLELSNYCRSAVQNHDMDFCIQHYKSVFN